MSGLNFDLAYFVENEIKFDPPDLRSDFYHQGIVLLMRN